MPNKTGYSVILKCKDGIKETICLNDFQLVNLINGLDKKYSINSITSFKEKSSAKKFVKSLPNYKEFLNKNENLELGV